MSNKTLDISYENARGTLVIVKLKSGIVWEGILSSHESSAEGTSFTLKLAQQQVSTDKTSQPYEAVLVVQSGDLVSLATKETSSVQTDTAISGSRAPVGGMRQLQRWQPTGTGEVTGGSLEGDNRSLDEEIRSSSQFKNNNRRNNNGGKGQAKKWDQFAQHERMTGKKSSFNFDDYSTSLDRGSEFYRANIQNAAREAKLIESQVTSNPHVAEERSQRINDGLTEEQRHSSVQSSVKPLTTGRPGRYIPPNERGAKNIKNTGSGSNSLNSSPTRPHHNNHKHPASPHSSQNKPKTTHQSHNYSDPKSPVVAKSLDSSKHDQKKISDSSAPTKPVPAAAASEAKADTSADKDQVKSSPVAEPVKAEEQLKDKEQKAEGKAKKNTDKEKEEKKSSKLKSSAKEFIPSFLMKMTSSSSSSTAQHSPPVMAPHPPPPQVSPPPPLQNYPQHPNQRFIGQQPHLVAPMQPVFVPSGHNNPNHVNHPGQQNPMMPLVHQQLVRMPAHPGQVALVNPNWQGHPQQHPQHPQGRGGGHAGGHGHQAHGHGGHGSPSQGQEGGRGHGHHSHHNSPHKHGHGYGNPTRDNRAGSGGSPGQHHQSRMRGNSGPHGHGRGGH